MSDYELFSDDTSDSQEGPIEPDDPAKVPKDPYPLLDGFEWVTIDMNDQKEVRRPFPYMFAGHRLTVSRSMMSINFSRTTMSRMTRQCSVLNTPTPSSTGLLSRLHSNTHLAAEKR